MDRGSWEELECCFWRYKLISVIPKGVERTQSYSAHRSLCNLLLNRSSSMCNGLCKTARHWSKRAEVAKMNDVQKEGSGRG